MYEIILIIIPIYSLSVLFLSYQKSRLWISKIVKFRAKQKGPRNNRISKTRQIRMFQAKLMEIRPKWIFYGGVITAILVTIDIFVD